MRSCILRSRGPGEDTTSHCGASPWGTRGAAYGPLVGWLVPVAASGVFWYVNELAVARRLGGKVATLRALLDIQAMCGTGAWCVGGRQCCLREWDGRARGS
jgi:hypothetical protein